MNHKQKALLTLGIILVIIGISMFVTGINRVEENIEKATKQNIVIPEAPKSNINYNAMAELINVKRYENGSKPVLMVNPKLNLSAQFKAQDMVSKQYWGHIDPQGDMPWKFFRASGYEYAQAGENLARCYETPEEVVEAWYESPKHRENILGNFREIGFGTVEVNGCTVVVSHFGRTE